MYTITATITILRNEYLKSVGTFIEFLNSNTIPIAYKIIIKINKLQ